jgi:hypothetical protein
MRDRLIELIGYNGSVLTRNDFEDLADYLLENGVIVPPCKVGDVVYGVFEDDVIEDEIILIELTKSAIYLSTCTERYMWVNGYLYSEMLDQKLYITKEEAEQALKGGAE